MHFEQARPRSVCAKTRIGGVPMQCYGLADDARASRERMKPVPSETDPPARPYGFFVILALTAVLYVAVLDIAATIEPGGGEAAFGNGVEALLATFALWIGLAILLMIAGVMGEMSRSGAIAAIVLVPMSGVAAFAAVDMCSRHLKGAIVFVAVLPLLIAYYAASARLPKLRGSFSAKETGLAAWGAVFALSVFAFLAAAA